MYRGPNIAVTTKWPVASWYKFLLILIIELVLLDLNVDSFTDLNQAFFCVNPSVASREEVLEVE